MTCVAKFVKKWSVQLFKKRRKFLATTILLLGDHKPVSSYQLALPNKMLILDPGIGGFQSCNLLYTVLPYQFGARQGNI